MGSSRQLAAIMFADIEGYTALMHRNEQNAIAIREKFITGTRDLVKKHGGRIVKFAGDGALCVFTSSISAVQSAIDIQLLMQKALVVPLRIGIHSGDVMLDEADIYGDGVNVASRVESFAIAGGIFISGKINDEIKNQEGISSVPLGKYRFKNIDHPIDLFAISNPGILVPTQKKLAGKGERYSPSAPIIKKYRLPLIVMIVLVAAGVFLGIKFYFDNQESAPKSVAVLPFEGQSTDSASNYLVDGMNEDILTQVSKIRDITVISNATMKSYKGTKLSPSEIGKELEAGAVLRGTVRFRGNNIRIFAELIDVATNSNIWAQTFDENYEKIFEIQSSIAEIIASVLKTKLSNTEKDLIRHRQTGNIDAYQIYLKGREFYNHYQKQDNISAIQYFRDAIMMDPEYALAWAGLADAFAQQNVRFGENVSWLDSAREAGNKSIFLDSTLVEGYLALGKINYYQGKYNVSLPYLQKAVQINPNHAPAVGNLGTLFFVQGEYAESLKWQKKSAALNPRNGIPFQIIGWIYRLYGNYSSAELWLNKSLKLQPFLDAYRELAYTYLLQNQKEKALALVPAMISQDSTNPRNHEVAGLISHMAGDIVNAKRHLQMFIELNPNIATDTKSSGPISIGQIMLKEGNAIDADIQLSNILQLNLKAIENGSQDDDPPYIVAAIYAIKGNKAECIKWLNKAVESKWVDYGLASKSPWFENVRNEPEFRQIIERIRKKMEVESKALF